MVLGDVRTNNQRLITVQFLLCLVVFLVLFYIFHVHLLIPNGEPNSDDDRLDEPQLQDDDKLKKVFQPIISNIWKRRLFDAFKECISVMEAASLRYFIYAGSLIGYYRHNQTMIPWDDDIDLVLIPDYGPDIAVYRKRIRKELIRRYGKNSYVYGAAAQLGMNMKFFPMAPTNSVYIANTPAWRWPFIDINLMWLSKTSKDKYYLNGNLFDFKMVHPMRRVSFEGLEVYVPNDILSILEIVFGSMTECLAPGYSHRIEDRITRNPLRVNCSQLNHLYSFTNI